MTLGVNPFVTPMTTNPGPRDEPERGRHDGDRSVRPPEFPAAFVTDITSNPNVDESGDWQRQTNNLLAISPSDVFGTWKAATKSGTSITPGADPAKNNWNLGTGADPAPTTTAYHERGLRSRGELELRKLGLHPGTRTGSQFMVHDGDQNNTGGDAGEACVNVTVP